MKTKYYPIIFVVLILFIFLLFFKDKSSKICDSHKTNSIILLENPLYIKLFKEGKGYFIEFKNNESSNKFRASSMIINFYKSINPVCSDVVYKFNPEYFTDIYCFKADSYNVCRGKKLHKGFPITIQKNNVFIDKMYIIDSYNWDTLEQKLKEIQNNQFNIIDKKMYFIDPRIVTLPERSRIYKINILYKDKKFILEKKKNQWFLSEKNITPDFVSKFINSLTMLQEDIESFINNNVDYENIMHIKFYLEFDEWKYSLWEKNSYDIQILQSKEDKKYLIKMDNITHSLKFDSFQQLENSLLTLIKQGENPSENTKNP